MDSAVERAGGERLQIPGEKEPESEAVEAGRRESRGRRDHGQNMSISCLFPPFVGWQGGHPWCLGDGAPVQASLPPPLQPGPGSRWVFSKRTPELLFMLMR